MSDEMLEWVRAYLERDEDIVVPIKKMWNEWHLSHPESPLDAFTAAILADEQVEHMASVDHNREWKTPPWKKRPSMSSEWKRWAISPARG